MDINSTVKLNNRGEMPQFGLGVYKATPGEETQLAVKWALESGYRHIDTATFYANERDVGVAIKESEIPREEIFVTTKLWNGDHGYEKTLRACEESLEKLQLEYLDLYLIHWPVENLRGKSWEALEKLYQEGKCQAIGVSNYTVRHLEELLGQSEIVPAVNQVEFSPYLYQKELLEFCNSHKIQLEAYASLTRGRRLGDPRLIAIAGDYKKTPAQLLIRWALQHGLIVIPKSVHKERIKENAQVFDFEIFQEDMKELDSFNENLHLCWDPTDAP